MNKKLFIAAIGFAIAMTTSQGILATPLATLPENVWRSVDRDTARYPAEASRNNMSGCATVEYTLTPTNQITNISVVSATHKSFAQEAQKATQKWDFRHAAAALTKIDVASQTRFQFCTGDNVSACAAIRQSTCKGNDVIAVTSSHIDNGGLVKRSSNYGYNTKSVTNIQVNK